MHLVVGAARTAQPHRVPGVEQLDLVRREEDEGRPQAVGARGGRAGVVHDDRPAADPRAVERARAPLPVPAHEQPALDRPGAALWCGVAAGDGPRVAVDLLGPPLRQVAAEQGGRGGDHPAPGRPGLERGQCLERVEQLEHRQLEPAVARAGAQARPRPVSTSALDRSAGSRRSSSISARPPVGLAAERLDGVAQLGHPVVAGRGAGGVDHPSILPQRHGMPPHLGQPSAKRASAPSRSMPAMLASVATQARTSGELVALLVDRALAQRLGQLPDLLGQPGDRGRQAPLPVARAVRALHQVLQLGQVHGRRVGGGRRADGWPAVSGRRGRCGGPSRAPGPASRRGRASTSPTSAGPR